VAESERGEDRLAHVGREVMTYSGPIDNLFVGR
jgi:hypothetical protein